MMSPDAALQFLPHRAPAISLQPDQDRAHRALHRSLAVGVLLMTILLLALVHDCVTDPALAESIQLLLLLSGQVVAVLFVTQRDGALLCIMLAGLLLKLTASSLHMALAHWGASDAMVYFARSVNIAATAQRAGDFFQTRQIWGTELIVAVTAALIKCFGASMMLLTAIYGCVSFWGEYLYYVTFLDAFPGQNAKGAAAGLFLLPSIIFWPAALGKDALMVFLLGVSALSMARLAKGKSIGAAFLLLFGIGGSYLVRPHIATLLIISIGAGFFAGRPVAVHFSRWRRIFRKTALAAMSLVALYACAQLLKVSSFAEGADRLRLSMQLNQQDGSGFSPGNSVTRSILLAPLLLVRPFPWEINGAQAGLAALEGTILAGFLLYRFRGIVKACAARKHDRFMIFLLWFIATNVLLFGVASSNFGLLVRERVMIYPPILLLCFAALVRMPASAGCGAPTNAASESAFIERTRA